MHLWTLGDSITTGVAGGFRNDIFNLLEDDGYVVDMVGSVYDQWTEVEDKDNEGHSGLTIGAATEWADGWLAGLHEPDVVLILLGTNDFAWWTNVQPVDQVNRMFGLVDHLLVRLPRSTLVVGTVIVQTPGIVEVVQRDRAEMVAEFNGLLREALPKHAAYGTRVYLAETGNVLDLSELYDGFHPTREAHTKLAGVWHDVLTQILPAP